MLRIFSHDRLVEITNQKLKELYDNNQLIIQNDENGKTEFNFGCYYYYIEENYDEAKKYYLTAIEKSNDNAMLNLGIYYETIEKNNDEAKKYYLMAIEEGNMYAMNNLGYYYETIEKNNDKAEKYYLMAIEKGDMYAMNNLGYYYHIKKNYDEAKKYYLMAIEKGNDDAMNNLGNYYETNEENYDEAKKYYLMAIKKGNTKFKTNLKNITTKLERYILYKKENINFNEKITKDIHIYNNKIKYHIKEESCPVCMDSKNCIPINCFAHYICTECYVKLYDKPCPICRL